MMTPYHFSLLISGSVLCMNSCCMQRLVSIDHQGLSTNAPHPISSKLHSFSKDKSSDMMNTGIHHTTMTEWIGADCPVDFLNVWFPAHWAPIVLRELHRREEAYRKAHNLWFDNPHVSDLPRVKEPRKDALRSRTLQYQIQVSPRATVRVLVRRL